MLLYFEDNTGTIVNNKVEMTCSAITGPDAKECADRGLGLHLTLAALYDSLGYLPKKDIKDYFLSPTLQNIQLYTYTTQSELQSICLKMVYFTEIEKNVYGTTEHLEY